MRYYVGLDVSLNTTQICVVDESVGSSGVDRATALTSVPGSTITTADGPHSTFGGRTPDELHATAETTEKLAA